MARCTTLAHKRKKQIRQILNISTKSHVESPSTSSSDTVHTVSDLQKLLKKSSKSVVKSEPVTSNADGNRTGIELCDVAAWAEVPFGYAMDI